MLHRDTIGHHVQADPRDPAVQVDQPDLLNPADRVNLADPAVRVAPITTITADPATITGLVPDQTMIRIIQQADVHRVADTEIRIQQGISRLMHRPIPQKTETIATEDHLLTKTATAGLLLIIAPASPITIKIMQQADVHRVADTEIRIQQRIGQQLLPPIHRMIIAADHRAAVHPILILHLRAEILRINRAADVRTDKSSCLS